MDTKRLLLEVRTEAAQLDVDLARLTDRREKLSALISGLVAYDPSLADIVGVDSSLKSATRQGGVVTSAPRKRVRNRKSPLRDSVYRVLESSGEWLTTEEVALVVDTEMSEGAVRKILTRGVEVAEVAKRPVDGRTNQYRWAGPISTSAPVVAGAEEVEESSNDSSLVEGGIENASATRSGDRGGNSHDDHGYGDRASVGGLITA